MMGALRRSGLDARIESWNAEGAVRKLLPAPSRILWSRPLELNTRGRYAVMAMADIAKFGEGQAVALSAIADRQKLSVAYLEQIFGQLRHAGLVESVRGRGGGYRLARPTAGIRVAEIMLAVEETTRMTRCGIEHGASCVGESRCLTHGLWFALEEHIRHFLSDVSLKDVIDGVPDQLRRENAAARRAHQTETFVNPDHAAGAAVK
ncbi:MAG TPA: Rrf2 family transcriptional regulator [Hyphomicrobiaceae bacterium]|nr:Rrf2 family transcriptional regulator [Hyphomicrobiaceae bacterium]